ncbi:unnamed protein product [Linum tenue]|uniref:Uncharacterized protein n=1 Tax=Linum tenue TaxID=586396 RepID=A0AAV0QID9_9ROSI|nr:unnamed protein product [Linum tenue]
MRRIVGVSGGEEGSLESGWVACWVCSAVGDRETDPRGGSGSWTPCSDGSAGECSGDDGRVDSGDGAFCCW